MKYILFVIYYAMKHYDEYIVASYVWKPYILTLRWYVTY